jgi:ribosomal protein L37AE/L43A
MPFDDIPEDHKPSYPCENCGKGNITESEDHKGRWKCDTCGWYRHERVAPDVRPSQFKAGDTVRLIRDPHSRGHVAHVYERGAIRIRFNDGSTELCQPEEVERE